MLIWKGETNGKIKKQLLALKRRLEATIALCFEWARCLVPRDALPLLRNIVTRTERRIQRTLPFRPYFLRTKLFIGHGGGGVGGFWIMMMVNHRTWCTFTMQQIGKWVVAHSTADSNLHGHCLAISLYGFSL